MLNILAHIQQYKSDAVLYKSEEWLSGAGDNPHDKADALKRVARMLSNIKDATLRGSYIDAIATGRAPHKIKQKTLVDLVSPLVDTVDNAFETESDNWDKLPGYMNREEIEMRGFCEVHSGERVGYFGWTGTGKSEISNFIIRPVFQVAGRGADSKHIIEMLHRSGRSILEIPTKALVSIDTLHEHLSPVKGVFYGTKLQLLRIANELMPQFPSCHPITYLGWQPEGFFAYIDSVYYTGKGDESTEPAYLEMNRFGIFESKNQHYLIPAASSVYAGTREDDFKISRVLTHKKAPVDFKTWATKLCSVYGQDGMVGLAFVLCTLFRDIVFAVDHNFPHLYAYGERSSGKSKWAESLTAFFFKGRSAFNLNSGTDNAFFDYMASFRNCVAHLNEFDDKVVKDEWFQSIKGIFDGEGRRRGKIGAGRMQTEIQESHSGLILTGQYLSTKDDNSIVTRSIIRPFFERQFTDQQKKEYDELKAWEAAGLTSLITDVLQHRNLIEVEYYKQFNNILGQWRRATSGEFNSRIFQNWAHLSAIWTLLAGKLSLPAAPDKFTAFCYKSAMEMSTFVRSSDTLTEFWNTVAFLLDQRQIAEDWDFKIVLWSSCKLRKSDGEEKEEIFNEPRKLLLIRFNTVHKLYQKAYKERTGKEGMTIENLKHYFSNRPYYIGQVKQAAFSRHVSKVVEKSQSGSALPYSTPTPQAHNELVRETTNTSAYVFDYNLLGCELERNGEF